MALELTSSAFLHKGNIPKKYTCDDDDINPPLKIIDVPEKAVSLALFMDDPDAVVGAWDHWVVFNIDPKTEVIKEGEGVKGIKGSQSDGALGYSGPCPPDGEHRYFFKLYALDIFLDLEEGSEKHEVERAMGGHILEQVQLMGMYKRD